MSELLIELFCEEIPAMMQKTAENAYLEIFTKYLQEKEIGFKEVRVFIGPRRITIHANELDKETKAKFVSIKGPAMNSPKQAIEGFCKSNNIKESDLTVKEVKGQNCYFYEQELASQKVIDILEQSLAEPCGAYVWPKSMYWSDYKIRWVRPLKNILCIFDGQIVPFKFGHLTANNTTYGHRFMSPKSLTVKNFAEYQQALKENFVILDRSDRIEIIKSSIAEKTTELNLHLKDDPILLEEVAGLVECPVTLCGRIEDRFLSLPSEVLVTSMRTHQKYFSVFDKNQNFAPFFLFVSNIKPSDPSTVIRGNEKVLSARLSDALYFYQQDLKKPLKEAYTNLEKVVFHAKLGSLKDKVDRLVKLTEIIEPKANAAKEAALICKSDILSEVVGEFPNLQGIMGYYYALAEGKSEEVAKAIRDHYKPQGPSDSLPRGTAAILALADKIDSLCGLMLAGEKPTGSKDPYALRRLALGIIRIVLENELEQNLVQLVNSTCSLYSSMISYNPEDTSQIISFIEERAKNYFKEEFDSNQISSVVDFGKDPSLFTTKLKLSSLNDFLQKEDGEALLNSYKRINNIILGLKPDGQLNKQLFNKYDLELFEFLDKNTEVIGSAQFGMALTALANLKPIIANFFDNVMVMDSNQEIANNRILLLHQTKQLFNKIANFDLL